MKTKFMFLILATLLVAGCVEPQPGPEITISLDKTEISVNEDATVTLVATVEPATDLPLVWSVNDETIASVSDGVVTGIKEGVCIVSVECGGKSAECVVTVLHVQEPPTAGIPEGYELIWSDEFNDNELNRTVWNIEVNNNGGGNGELQYYTARSENVHIGEHPVTGEHCVILTAIKEEYQGRHCTSGRINTKNNLAFTHGMIEGRINIPLTANGLWPAFWMMGNDYDQVGWPKCGETDIMEMGNKGGINRGQQDRDYSGWWHWGTAWNMYGNGAYPNTGSSVVSSYPIQNSWHTFRMYWDENIMKMYLDQDVNPNVAPYATLNCPASDDVDAPGKYFHKPFFILFNLAIGGQGFTGVGNISGVTALNEANNYTSHYYIDYVRIYQRGMENETFWKK
ncbi:MAG: family 16 glycosylhydrolase [Prevotellaceae bacterium]|jgi:beta-glucanase (GH16 family)|nr:family 16 glycosylhydrolase [Prevotellaceae bacterium]